MGARARALRAFVRLGRPQFLVGGFLLYGLGAAVALLGGAGRRFSWPAYALGQAAISSIQLMTHYANDYFDLAADHANATPTRWSGGSRVLTDGLLSPNLALWAARVLAAAGAGLAIAIAWRSRAAGGDVPAAGGLTAAILVLSGALAWCYSAPPLVLHSRGLGEATTALVVTGLTPLCGFLSQVDRLSGAAGALPALAAALWPLVGLQFAMLLAIEFPDAAGDAAVGKRTLVVRMGGARAAALCRAVLVASYGALPVWRIAGAPAALMLAAGVTGPAAAWHFHRLGRGAWRSPERWEGLAFWGVALLVGTAAAELVAALWMLRGAGG